MIETQVQALHSGWHAELGMCFVKKFNKTVVTQLKHQGPLRIQRPFYPEGHTSHVYLLHPPGGVVGGDSIDVDIQVNAKAHALITTPGATKFYRSGGQTALVKQQLTVHENAILEWFPQENILFPGARLNLATRFNLSGNAKVIAWEISCLGRPVNQEIFDEGQLKASLEIYRDNKPLLLEKLRVLSKQDLVASSGLRAYPMQAIFFATGVDSAQLDGCREILDQLSPQFPVGLTLLDDVLVLRALSSRTEKLQAVMIAIWKQLRPALVGKQAEVPRIWAT